MPLVAISGGFDPIHEGHIDLIEGAGAYGDIIVYLNSDEWLKRKKGYCYQKWGERARILLAMRNVVVVYAVDDEDGTVTKGLRDVKPHYFANGGDRTNENTPELVYCLDHGIKPLWGVGGGKVASSSALIRDVNG